MRSIRVYDSITEWRWHTRPEIVSMFVHLLILANEKDKEVGTVTVKRGQLLTSLRDLSEVTGISLQSTRTSLAHLESTGEITRESTHQGTLITVCKYVDYQDRETLPNTRPTHDQHTANTPNGEKPTQESTHPLTQRQDGLTPYGTANYESGISETNTRINTPTDTAPTQELTHFARAGKNNNNNNNIDINKNINNSCCCCSGADAGACEGFSFWSLPEDQQQKEQDSLFEMFFFSNFRNVEAEVKRFIATNESHQWMNKGRTECYSTPAQRRAIAQLWKPASKNPRIPSSTFLMTWHKLYTLAKKSDPDVARLMLDERVSVGEIDDGRVFLVCHQKFWDWMTDKERAEKTRRILNTFTTKKINSKIIY